MKSRLSSNFLMRIATFFLLFLSGFSLSVRAEDGLSNEKELASSSNDSDSSPPYEDLYTFTKKTVFVSDPFTWVYSKDFAVRFKLPGIWIDDSLKGAIAVAWRMTNVGEVFCGFSGREDNCKDPLECQLDIYYDNSLYLPWLKPEIVRDNLMLGLTSTRFLASTSGSRSRRYGTKGVLWASGSFQYGKYNPGISRVAAFDREYEPGVGFFTLIGHGVCPKYTGSEKVFMNFYDLKSREVIHKIEFPKDFMIRANKSYEAKNKPNEVWLKKTIYK